MDNATSRPLYYGTQCTGSWVSMGAEYFAPTTIRTQDRSARSESLYRLRYTCRVIIVIIIIIYRSSDPVTAVLDNLAID